MRVGRSGSTTARRGAGEDAASRSRVGRVSRRRFLELIAASSAAVAAGSVTTAAAPAPPKGRRKAAASGEPRPRTPAIRAEIEQQKQYLASTLKKIRDYPLPAGSDPAFVFTALPAAARERRK